MHWLPRMAKGEVVGALGNDRAGAGSDVQGIRPMRYATATSGSSTDQRSSLPMGSTPISLSWLLLPTRVKAPKARPFFWSTPTARGFKKPKEDRPRSVSTPFDPGALFFKGSAAAGRHCSAGKKPGLDHDGRLPRERLGAGVWPPRGRFSTSLPEICRGGGLWPKITNSRTHASSSPRENRIPFKPGVL
ncbi:MAG: hypothetical protein CM15mP103_04960 [Gammaproteobacteria bacterium]|nr:MAG: hypothetical protein CM15mP103_04960 [Gammaproteobacteria bacterium]